MALIDNLVSYWKLDESSGNAADSVGSNTLTNNNSTPFVSGKINNGADLEKDNSQTLSITNASQTGLNMSTTPFTISAWVNVESTGTDKGLVSKIDSGDSAGYRLNVSATNTVGFYCSGGGSSNDLTTTTTLSNGTWYHLVALRDGTNLKIYINGVLDSSMADGAKNVDNTSKFIIGSLRDTAAYYFDGIIDEVGVWSRALTAGEVSQLYNGSTGLSYSFTNPGISYVSNTYGATNLTYAVTTSGDNRFLAVGISGGDTFTDNVTGVTYAGVAMTLEGKKWKSGDRWNYLYTLANPTSGTNNVVISVSASNLGGSNTIVLNGVKQLTPTSGANTASGNSDTLTVSSTPSDLDSWIIAFANGSGILTATSPAFMPSLSVGQSILVGNKTINPVASTAIGATTTSGQWAIISTCVAPVQVSTTSSFLIFL